MSSSFISTDILNSMQIAE